MTIFCTVSASHLPYAYKNRCGTVSSETPILSAVCACAVAVWSDMLSLLKGFYEQVELLLNLTAGSACLSSPCILEVQAGSPFVTITKDTRSVTSILPMTRLYYATTQSWVMFQRFRSRRLLPNRYRPKGV